MANEFFDALPVHRLVWVNGGPREVFVDWAGSGFVERLGEPSDPRLADWVEASGAEPEEGWRAEVGLAVDLIFAALARLVPRGVLLGIDYGYETADPRRGADTVVAYYRHHWNSDLYRRVGDQDLTAHVDLAGLFRTGAAHGFALAGLARQRDFLLARGFPAAAAEVIRSEPTAARQWQARFDLAQLIDTRGLGRLQVFALRRGAVDYALTR